MNDYSIASLSDVDSILWIIDGTQNFGSGDEFIINLLQKTKNKVYLVVNKIDLANDMYMEKRILLLHLCLPLLK